jgi:hypothetical protein
MEPFPDPVGLKTSGSGFGSPTLLFGKCSLFVYTRKAGLFAALLGDLFTWGKNRNGCLGLGTYEDQFFPLKVSLAGRVQTAVLGVDHTIVTAKPW